MRISDWSSDGCSSDLIEQALSRKRTSSARGGGSVTSSIRRTEISSDNSCTRMARIGVSPHFNVVWEKHRAIAWGRLDELQRLDRTSVVKGKRWSVRADSVGRRIIKQKNTHNYT